MLFHYLLGFIVNFYGVILSGGFNEHGKYGGEVRKYTLVKSTRIVMEQMASGHGTFILMANEQCSGPTRLK